MKRAFFRVGTGLVLFVGSGCNALGTRPEYTLADASGRSVAEVDVEPFWHQDGRILFSIVAENHSPRPLRIEAGLRIAGQEDAAFVAGRAVPPPKLQRYDEEILPGKQSWFYFEFTPADLGQGGTTQDELELELELRAIQAGAEILTSARTFPVSRVQTAGYGGGWSYVDYGSFRSCSGGSSVSAPKTTVRLAPAPRPKLR